MFLRIKNRINKELKGFILGIDKSYSLSKIAPLLYRSIKEFALRDGKRIRPILFLIGYLGFAKKAPAGFYRSAVSLELLHDFMLVHDDIIDKSLTRRGKPSMHAMLNSYLGRYKNIKFNGQDLAIVIGDVMYALALHAFLSVTEDAQNKEAALKKLIEAAIYTGSGELIELLCGIKDIDKVTKQDIYRIYDFKTANYTFASPLSIGATLAGAEKGQINRLFNYGIYLGRAFQIKDDYLGIFGVQAKTGKDNLTDLKESKKTILIWYAYTHSNEKNKAGIKRILAKKDLNKNDLYRMRRIIVSCGAVDYAKKEIAKLIKKAFLLNKSSAMHPKYRRFLEAYSRETLAL
jgi:geranylgeranyl diphosphate synthase type I